MFTKRFTETITTLTFWSVGISVLLILALILLDLIIKGGQTISLDFLTLAPSRAGLSGGISSLLIGTSAMVLLTLVIVFPISLGTAILLQEKRNSNSIYVKFIRRSLDILAGVPSIVFGLFGLKLFVETLGMGWSVLSGSLTLACVIFPITILSTEIGLNTAHKTYCQLGAALNLSKWGMLKTVIIPSALPNIMAGMLLGIGRCMAESAAVMFTAGASTKMIASVADSTRSLAYHIYVMSIEVPGGTSVAYGTALILVAMIALISLVAHFSVQLLFKQHRLSI